MQAKYGPPGSSRVARAKPAWLAIALIFTLLASCAAPVPAPTPTSPPPQFDPSINLDAETQALISRAPRVVFLIPFSHWDTDWHQDFSVYSRQADGNILAAIRLAQSDPRFRYSFEQVLFVQHFWETHPESQADLKALVQKRQLTFAWAGITQPETSLAAPGVQWHNLLLGEEWITETFGAGALPASPGAWQSDAFGNSAALPLFLSQAGISHLFLGRWSSRCDPATEDCQTLPHAFYWRSPLPSPEGTDGANANRILVAAIPYANAWAALLNKATPEQQQAALQGVFDEQFKRTTSRYLFLPYGFDFLDPNPALLDLVNGWNAANPDTPLVFADPETAFNYLATQDLPEITVDLNPLWQAFYGTRPFARIADKESEFFLTAADKFTPLLGDQQPQGWQTTAVNAHYDNLSAVGYDSVWESSQRPRFEQSVSVAADELASVLAGIAGRVTGEDGSPARLLAFNPLSWERGGVVEVRGDNPAAGLPLVQQPTGPETVAYLLDPVPPTGFASVNTGPTTPQISHPAAVTEGSDGVTLSNGLVSVTLDPAHGGSFSSLRLEGDSPAEILQGSGDDLVYLEDNGDVYGARFGGERARQSKVPARVDVLAGGPLVGRLQVSLALGGQPVTKTITLRADSPLVEVSLQMQTLPQTSAVLQIPTVLEATSRTDDLGFAAFEHTVDTRPIAPGDITYRRKIFYPFTYWSDVSSGGRGLSLITHGLQGVGGAGNLYLLLARSVSDQGNEGVNDTDHYTLHYAYYPHQGDAAQAEPWLQAYDFNQPLILAWQSGDQLKIQLPFLAQPLERSIAPSGPALTAPYSLASAEGAVIVDVYRAGGRSYALLVDYDPTKPATLRSSYGATGLTVPTPGGWLWLAPLE